MTTKRLLQTTSIAACLAALTSTAWAHGSDPAVAYMNVPVGVGNVVDDSFMLNWVDADRSIPTGTATVDFYYTNAQPPTFLNGERHPALVGEVVVSGIIEKEMPNEYVWDTSGVPAGSYLLWSEVLEPPEKNMAIKIIEFSPGILTVAHPGDPVHPAVFLTTPSSPFQFADDMIDVEYLAFDPDGTARVRLEAGMDPNGENFILIADDLPATSTGSFEWNTSTIEEGDWILRATITNASGLSFHHYSRYFLLVTHAVIRSDAGVMTDGGQPDAGGFSARDAGGEHMVAPDDSCACRAAFGAGRGTSRLGWWLAAAVLFALARFNRNTRNRPSCRWQPGIERQRR